MCSPIIQYVSTYMDDCVASLSSQVMYQNTSKAGVHSEAKARFGRNLKRVRKQACISQEALALRIDADQAYISRLEAGRLNPTLESISEIANALEIGISELFN